MKKTATAAWSGDLKTGKGTISTQSGALKNQPYGFNTRFGDTPGTNPEELLGAAHAGCFTMALSNILSEAGLAPQKLDTQAEVTLDKVEGGFAITAVHLTVEAVIRAPAPKPSTRPRARPKRAAPSPRCSTPRSPWTPSSGPDRPRQARPRAAPLARPIQGLLKINLTVMPEQWKMRTILRKLT